MLTQHRSRSIVATARLAMPSSRFAALRPTALLFLFSGTLLFLFFTFGSASAQSDNADVSGRVIDQHGAALSRVVVTLSRIGPHPERSPVTVATDEAGAFKFRGLSRGEYLLSAEGVNFTTVTQSVMLTGEGAGREVELRLSPRGFDEFVTVTAGDEGFQAQTATTAMRTDTALRDTPQSIQVITRQVIEEQQAVSINDVVRNVSGVSVPNSSGGRAEDFTIRGFTSARNTYKDGFRNDFNSNRASHETSNIERVEVLKGPASVLFGRLDPSGVVNFVTKKPLAEHYYSLLFTGGKFNFYKPALDFGGPLNARRTLLYRFNGAYENADTFRDFVERERVFVAPSLTWIVGDGTTLSLDAEAMKGTSLIDRGLVALDDGVAPVPSGRYLGDPAIPYKYRQGKLGATLSHTFDDHWSLRSAFRVALNKADYDSRQPRRLRPDNRTLELSLDYADQSLQTYYWQNDVIAKFQTGGVGHTLLFGGDIGRERFASVTLSGPTRTIDIYNPVYNFAPGTVSRRGHSITTNISGGVYAQDQITLGSNLKLLLGGRFDYYEQKNDNRFTTEVSSAVDRAFTPRVGVVYQPVQPVSLYVSFSESFQPQLQLTFDNMPFEPETGMQYETGIKLELWKRRLALTAATYQITKSNVGTPDPINPGFSVQLGEQRSRGFELDATARPTSGWNVLTSYGYTDAVVTKDTRFPVGAQLSGAPRHTASLWTSYQFGGGPARGFGFGAGVFAVSRRFGDLEHTFTVPGYARVDASVFYKIHRAEKVKYRLAFNVNNVLDKEFYEGVRGRLGVVPGAPLSGVGTFQIIF
ncbi:MAG: TonB-dependent receptor [Pyrinomonadaceae bacterium]|nr:TonB-dependent receptor [Pyrinomonadaceae bacterium]